MKLTRKQLQELINESVAQLINEGGYEEAWELIMMPQPEIKNLVKFYFGLENINVKDPIIDEFCKKLGLIIDQIEPSMINWIDLSTIAWDGDNKKWLPMIDKFTKTGMNPKEIFDRVMKIRDAGSNRTRQPGGIDALYKDVLLDEYEPPVLLHTGGKLYAVGGRTRLFAAYSQRKEKIRAIIVKDDDLILAQSLMRHDYETNQKTITKLTY